MATTTKTYGSQIHNFTGISMYAKIKEPNKANDPKYTDAWETDLLLNEKDVKRAAALGLAVKTRDNYMEFCEDNGLVEKGYTGKYIKSRKYTLKSAGKMVAQPDGTEVFKPLYNEDGPVKEPAKPPIVRDAKGNDIPHEDVPLIGNGSLISIGVVVTPSAAKTKGEWGSRLISVEIKELVEYEPSTNVQEGTYEYNPKTDAPAEQSPAPAAEAEVKKEKKPKVNLNKYIESGDDGLADEMPWKEEAQAAK